MDERVIVRAPIIRWRREPHVSPNELNHSILHVEFLLRLGAGRCVSLLYKPIGHGLIHLPYAPKYSHSVTKNQETGVARRLRR